MSITNNAKSILCLLVLASVGFGVRSAEARLITWEIAGEISIVSDPNNELAGLIVPGSPFSVSFTYESTTPDEFPNALDNGSYPGAIKAVSGQVGGISFSNPKGSFGFFSVTNDALSDIPADVFGFESLIDTIPAPVDFFKINFSAADLSGTIFADDSLPLFPPPLDMLDSSSFILQTLGPTVWVRGELTSITPEPTSLLLFALAGVLACRRNRHRAMSILGVFLVIGCAFTPQANAQWVGGPVLIGGDETDARVVEGTTEAGKAYAKHAFDFLGREVTNGNKIAVCIGCNPDSETAIGAFNDSFDASGLPAEQWTRGALSTLSDITAFFDGTGAVNVNNTGIIYMPSRFVPIPCPADQCGSIATVFGGIKQTS